MGNPTTIRQARRTADRLAARQLGVIAYRQARVCGLTRDEILGTVASARWTRCARGVFRDTGASETWQQAAMIACLAGPAGTVASHFTACALFGLAEPPTVPHVTSPSHASARSPVARVHRSFLLPDDVTRIGPVPVTMPHRTLVDVASLLGPGRALDDIVDAALCRGLATVAAVDGAMSRSSARPGRKGLPALAASIEPWRVGAPAESVPEMTLYRRVVGWGFVPPTRQLEIVAPDGRVLGRVDMGWAPFRAGLEYDGREAHAPRRWASDADRQEAIEALGWHLVRAVAEDLRPGAHRVRDELELYVPMAVAA
jgi:hypothetical protein